MFMRSLALFALLMTAMGNAHAADLGNKLGGGCCADLEERIAELEVTAATKGNRKVALQIYGQVNEAIMFWDATSDPGSKRPNISTSAVDPTLFGFRGTSKIDPKTQAGFNLEYGLATDNSLQLRQANIYVNGELGKVTLGKADTVTHGLAEISLANTDAVSRTLNAKGLAAIGSTSSIATNTYDGTQRELIRYDTPSMYGLKLGASYANGNVMDGGARYSVEAGGFRFAAGVGYRDDDHTQRTILGSASMMHIDTGLFANIGAAQQKDFTGLGVSTAWQAQGGIERKLIEIGATTVFGEIGRFEQKTGSTLVSSPWMYGGGLVQAIDSARIDLYATARRYEGDTTSTWTTEVIGGARVRF